jgi:hypothetical protein
MRFQRLRVQLSFSVAESMEHSGGKPKPPCALPYPYADFRRFHVPTSVPAEKAPGKREHTPHGPGNEAISR